MGHMAMDGAEKKKTTDRNFQRSVSFSPLLLFPRAGDNKDTRTHTNTPYTPPSPSTLSPSLLGFAPSVFSPVFATENKNRLHMMELSPPILCYPLVLPYADTFASRQMSRFLGKKKVNTEAAFLCLFCFLSTSLLYCLYLYMFRSLQ